MDNLHSLVFLELISFCDYLQGELARLEDAASPPCSQRAQLAGEAIVAEKTGKKEHLKRFLTKLGSSQEDWKREIMDELLRKPESHLSRPWTARPPNIIIGS